MHLPPSGAGLATSTSMSSAAGGSCGSSAAGGGRWLPVATSTSLGSAAGGSIGSSETLSSSRSVLYTPRHPDALGQAGHSPCKVRSARTGSTALDPAFFERLEELSPEGFRMFMESVAAQENAQLRRRVDSLEKQRQTLEDHAQGLADEVASLSSHLLMLESQVPIVQASRVTKVSAAKGKSSNVPTVAAVLAVPTVRAQRPARPVDTGCLEELVMIREQLEAVQTVKDVMHEENVNLQERLVHAEQEVQELQKQQLLNKPPSRQKAALDAGAKFASCVVCLERPPTVVCMPCKHLALCTHCCDEALNCCPICRCDVVDKIDVFLP